MSKSIVIAVAMILSVTAQASDSMVGFIMQKQISALQQNVEMYAPNWKVGDENNYKLSALGGVISGTTKMYIREMSETEIWIVQDVDMMGQKQKAETLIDAKTGEVKKVIVDGKEQEQPKTDFEVIEQKEATVKVPAGTFTAVYLKLKDNANNGQITEMWVNPREIPINGMAKTLANSQFGKVTIELTSFIKK